MHASHRRGPVGPVPASNQSRLDPFRQIGHLLQCGPRKLAHAFVGQSIREWINRLSKAGRRIAVDGNDMIGVHHLQFIAIAFELARNDPFLSNRQLLARPSTISAEKCERQIVSGDIGNEYPQRCARVVAVAVVHDGNGNNDVAANIGDIQQGNRLAIGPVGRKMIQHILHPLEPQSLERLCQTRADAFHGAHFCK